MKNIKKFGLSLLVLGLVLVGGFSSSVQKAHAAANITIVSAEITGAHQFTIVFNTGGRNLVAAPITAYGIANNGVSALTLASDAGVDPRDITDITVYPNAAFTATYTFDGAAASGNDTGSLILNLPTNITDTAGNTFTSATTVPMTNGQTPVPTAPTAVAVTPVGGTVVANTLNGTNTNMTASATIIAGEATGGSAVLKVGTTTIATDATVLIGDTTVNFDLGLSSTAALQAAVTAGGVMTVTLFNSGGGSAVSAVANPTLVVDYITPTFTSAVLNNTTATTVDLVITGTEFNAFFTSAGDTANKISFNGFFANSVVLNSPTQITATYSISSVGTAKVGNITISANAMKDTAGNPNILATILNASITDSAAPIVVSISPANTSGSNDRMNPIIIIFSEPMTIGTFAFATVPVVSYTPTWSNGNKTVSLAHNTFSSGQLYTTTISAATDAATIPNSMAGLSYHSTFTTTVGSASSTSTPAVAVSNISVLINGGATTSTSNNVVLTIAATNATSMRFSNNPFFTDSAWENYATTKNWTLSSGNGSKIVYVKFISSGGVESDPVAVNITVSAAPVTTTTTITATVTPSVPATPATPAVPKTETEGCKNGFLFSPITGQACVFTSTIPAVPATPATPATVTGTVTTTTTTTAGVTTVKTYNFGTTTLKNGSKGEPVKELQRFLNKVLKLGLKEDGILGPKTIAIVKKWQKDNGLVADGLIGAKTKAKMNASVQ